MFQIYSSYRDTVIRRYIVEDYCQILILAHVWTLPRLPYFRKVSPLLHANITTSILLD